MLPTETGGLYKHNPFTPKVYTLEGESETQWKHSVVGLILPQPVGEE